MSASSWSVLRSGCLNTSPFFIGCVGIDVSSPRVRLMTMRRLSAWITFTAHPDIIRMCCESGPLQIPLWAVPVWLCLLQMTKKLLDTDCHPLQWHWSACCSHVFLTSLGSEWTRWTLAQRGSWWQDTIHPSSCNSCESWKTNVWSPPCNTCIDLLWQYQQIWHKSCWH